MQDSGARVSDIAPVADAQITLSENTSEYLMVEEIRKGDERQVFIASWKRTARALPAGAGVALEKKLLWEQDDPILDVVFTSDTLLVLSPQRISVMTKRDGQWVTAGTADLPVRSWPRDMRGRLRLTGSAYQALLPGIICKGAAQPLTADCQPATDAWLLESGSRDMLLAGFTANRNYFDGRITTQAGVRKQLAPFFSAASANEQGSQIWLLAMVDGSTRIFDGNFDPVGAIPGWGSDIVGVGARCGGGAQVLATRPGDAGEADTIQAFAIVNRAPAPLTAPLGFSGPVTALWPSGGTSAIAVARDIGTGKYAAFLVTVACGL
jgi:hypothetical protein